MIQSQETEESCAGQHLPDEIQNADKKAFFQDKLSQIEGLEDVKPWLLLGSAPRLN